MAVSKVDVNILLDVLKRHPPGWVQKCFLGVELKEAGLDDPKLRRRVLKEAIRQGRVVCSDDLKDVRLNMEAHVKSEKKQGEKKQGKGGSSVRVDIVLKHIVIILKKHKSLRRVRLFPLLYQSLNRERTKQLKRDVRDIFDDAVKTGDVVYVPHPNRSDHATYVLPNIGKSNSNSAPQPKGKKKKKKNRKKRTQPYAVRRRMKFLAPDAIRKKPTGDKLVPKRKKLKMYYGDKNLYNKIVDGLSQVHPLVVKQRINGFVKDRIIGQPPTERFKTMLTAESTQAIFSLHIYDQPNESLGRFGQYYTLEVPGLAEKRPSVLKGDFVSAFRVSGKGQFSGEVVEIRRNTLILRFHRTFDGKGRYDIEFNMNRRNIRQMKRVLEMDRLSWMLPLPMLTLDNSRFKMHFINGSAQAVNDACSAILSNDIDCVGFDMEWLSAGTKCSAEDEKYRNVPAIVQLAYHDLVTRENKVLVIRIVQFQHSRLPENLVTILTSEAIQKVGVGLLQNDLPKLRSGFLWSASEEAQLADAKAFIELSVLVKELKMDLGEVFKVQSAGLATLTKKLLSLRLSKESSVRRFPWHTGFLAGNRKQQEYAALDAVAGYLVYQRIVRLRMDHNEAIPLPLQLQIEMEKGMQIQADEPVTYLKRNADCKLDTLGNPNLVKRQLQAVKHVLSGDILTDVESKSSELLQPLIVNGPPGTGKTSTLVEMISQITRGNPKARILFCTSTNSAADHAAVKIVEQKNSCTLLRMSAFFRNPNTVAPPLNKPEYCLLTKEGYETPTLDQLKEYQVVVSTTMNAGKFIDMFMPVGFFTHIVLDEAGQAMTPESLLPLSLADRRTNVILAGDPKQLGPVVKCMASAEQGLAISLLETLTEEPETVASVIMLTKSFRAHPAIMKLYSDLFYDSKLTSHAPPEVTQYFLDPPCEFLKNPEYPVMFIHSEGEEDYADHSVSIYNQEEVNEVRKVLQQIKAARPGLENDEIGVISPYRLQTDKLKNMRNQYPEFKDILMDTTELFQGKEKKVIVMTLVRSNADERDVKFNLGFLTNPKRLNVAISRARSLLVIVGNAKTLILDELFGQLINEILQNDAVRFNGKTSKQELEALLYQGRDEPEEQPVANSK